MNVLYCLITKGFSIFSSLEITIRKRIEMSNFVVIPISDQIWRVGLNFNWKGIYYWIPSKIKGNINNCTSIDKYKLTKPFHQKIEKNKYCFFNFLTIKHPSIFTWKIDIFLVKLILNTLSCHMCIINFTF